MFITGHEVMKILEFFISFFSFLKEHRNMLSIEKVSFVGHVCCMLSKCDQIYDCWRKIFKNYFPALISRQNEIKIEIESNQSLTSSVESCSLLLLYVRMLPFYEYFLFFRLQKMLIIWDIKGNESIKSRSHWNFERRKTSGIDMIYIRYSYSFYVCALLYSRILLHWWKWKIVKNLRTEMKY